MKQLKNLKKLAKSPDKGIYKINLTEDNISDYQVILKSINEDKTYYAPAEELKGQSNGENNFSFLPNGLKIITESRDLQADDAGYLLLITRDDIELPPVVLTIPDPSPLQSGESFAIINGVDLIKDKDNGFRLGDTESPLCTPAINECVLFTTTNVEDANATFIVSSVIVGDGNEGNLKTALRYLMDNVGALYPNGVEVVTTTRDFQDSDIGKFLFLAEGVGLTMPTSAPFYPNNKLIGIVAGSTNYPCDNFYEVVPGKKVYLYGSGHSVQTSNESLTLITGSDFDNSQQTVAPVSGTPVFVNESDTVGYTATRYLMDNIGGGGSSFITKTKAEIDALITANGLVAGATYKITGVHPTLYNDGTNSGTTIYLKAIENNKLETQGTGLFYNPKYDQSISGFGIWENKMYGAFSNIVGSFDYQNKESVTADNGATGILLAEGMIQWVSGDWSAATSIVGDVSGATADVSDFVTPTYSIGDKVIWGGYSWTNNTGAVGSSVDVLTLDNTNWSKDVYNTTNYNIAYDMIEYDYANDMIIRRYESSSNVDVRFNKVTADIFFNYYGFSFNAISVQQFGNAFDFSTLKGVLSKLIDNGYDESINFCGAYQYNLTFGSNAFQSYLTFGGGAIQTNLTFESSAGQYNLTFGGDARQYNLTFGSSAYQQDITFGGDAYQQNLTFGSGANQQNLTFGSGAFQSYLTFESGAFQTNLTFGGGANQTNLTFESDARQYNLTFGGGANQQNLTFGSSAGQYNLTFESDAYQTNLTFGSGASINFNNQTLSSPITNATFRGQFTMPDISAATHIYDATLIKDVYARPDGALKIRYYDNSDALVIAGIAD